MRDSQPRGRPRISLRSSGLRPLFGPPNARLRSGQTLFLQQRIALLDEPCKLFILLRDPIRVSIFILGAGDSGRLLDQLPDVVTRDGDALFEFRERK
jgi:hypothetical protein